MAEESNGGRTRTRTWDPLIKSQLLYQLSYAPEPGLAWPERVRKGVVIGPRTALYKRR